MSLGQDLEIALGRLWLIIATPFLNPILPILLDTMDTRGQHLGSSPFLDCWADVINATLLYPQ
jgi:hypothetical protein